MEKYQDLKDKSTKTDEEKMIVTLCEMVHNSKAVSSQSEAAVYHVAATKAGLEIEGEDKPATPSDTNTEEIGEEKAEDAVVDNPTDFDDGVVLIFRAMLEDGTHLTKTGKPELPELNGRLEKAGFEALTGDERDQLFDQLGG